MSLRTSVGHFGTAVLLISGIRLCTVAFSYGTHIQKCTNNKHSLQNATDGVIGKGRLHLLSTTKILHDEINERVKLEKSDNTALALLAGDEQRGGLLMHVNFCQR